MKELFTDEYWIAILTNPVWYSPEMLIPLFLISFTESCCFIIPPDPLLPFLVLERSLPHVIALTAFTSGTSVLGAMFGYLIGKMGGQPVVDKLFKREKVEKVEKLFQKYDVWAIGIAAFTPIPYKVFTITAGVFNLHFVRFLLVSIVARSTRYFLISMLSYMMLKNMSVEEVTHFLHSTQFKLITLGIFAGVVVLYLLYRTIFKKKNAPAAA